MTNDPLRDFLGHAHLGPRTPNAPRPSPLPVERVDTHCSMVYLVGDYVYKFKKPVKFDFLDFSTVADREKACQRELRLNRRLCDDVYLDVLPLYVDRQDQWSWTPPATPPSENPADAPPPPAEWCVQMRRLPEHRMLHRLIADDDVQPDDFTLLADRLAEFYREGKTSDKINRAGLPTNLATPVRANFKSLHQLIPKKHARELLGPVESALLECLACQEELFQQRVQKSRIRDGHGDLRAEHICLLEPPAIFDCLEFSDKLRRVDIIDDLSFLLMDLTYLGREDLADLFWKMMADRLNEDPQSPLRYFYQTHRALVRAKVKALQTFPEPNKQQKQANWLQCQKHIELAYSLTKQFHTPRILATIGMMGAGKSTLAHALSNELGMHAVSSGLIRDLIEEERQEADRSVNTPSEKVQQVYNRMIEEAERAFLAGQSVVLDATFITKRHREQITALAQKLNTQPLFLRCQLQKSDALVRLDTRAKKTKGQVPGRPESYEEQSDHFESPVDIPQEQLLTLDMTKPVPDLVQRVVRLLKN